VIEKFIIAQPLSDYKDADKYIYKAYGWAYKIAVQEDTSLGVRARCLMTIKTSAIPAAHMIVRDIQFG